MVVFKKFWPLFSFWFVEMSVEKPLGGGLMEE